MIKGLLHEPGKRLRAVRANSLTDKFDQFGVQSENVQRPTLLRNGYGAAGAQRPMTEMEADFQVGR